MDITYMTTSELSDICFNEKEVEWRKSHKESIEEILELHILSAFGQMKSSAITKQDILTVRDTLAKVQSRTKKQYLLHASIILLCH